MQEQQENKKGGVGCPREGELDCVANRKGGMGATKRRDREKGKGRKCGKIERLKERSGLVLQVWVGLHHHLRDQLLRIRQRW